MVDVLLFICLVGMVIWADYMNKLQDDANYRMRQHKHDRSVNDAFQGISDV